MGKERDAIRPKGSLAARAGEVALSSGSPWKRPQDVRLAMVRHIAE